MERTICNGGKYLSQSNVMRKSCFTKEKNKSSCILISTSSDQSRFTFIFCHKNWCFFWSTASTLLFFPEQRCTIKKVIGFYLMGSFPSGSNNNFDVVWKFILARLFSFHEDPKKVRKSGIIVKKKGQVFSQGQLRFWNEQLFGRGTIFLVEEQSFW